MIANAPNTARFKQFAVNATTPTPTCSQAELAMYHHQSLGSPQKDTLLRALREHPTQFETFPGLTYKLIRTNLPSSEATEKDTWFWQESKVLPAAEEVCLAEEDEIYCYVILDNNNDNTIYSDLTGEFPIESYDGKNYIFIAYVYKLNSIFTLPMKSWGKDSMISAFKEVCNKLEGLGQKPKFHILDNECSKCIQNVLEKKETKRHHVAPHNHRVKNELRSCQKGGKCPEIIR